MINTIFYLQGFLRMTLVITSYQHPLRIFLTTSLIQHTLLTETNYYRGGSAILMAGMAKPAVGPMQQGLKLIFISPSNSQGRSP